MQNRLRETTNQYTHFQDQLERYCQKFHGGEGKHEWEVFEWKTPSDVKECFGCGGYQKYLHNYLLHGYWANHPEIKTPIKDWGRENQYRTRCST